MTRTAPLGPLQRRPPWTTAAEATTVAVTDGGTPGDGAVNDQSDTGADHAEVPRATTAAPTTTAAPAKPVIGDTSASAAGRSHASTP